MLRPQVFAIQEGDVSIGLSAPRNRPSTATLQSLAEEDRGSAMWPTDTGTPGAAAIPMAALCLHRKHVWRQPRRFPAQTSSQTHQRARRAVGGSIPTGKWRIEDNGNAGSASASLPGTSDGLFGEPYESILPGTLIRSRGDRDNMQGRGESMTGVLRPLCRCLHYCRTAGTIAVPISGARSSPLQNGQTGF